MLKFLKKKVPEPENLSWRDSVRTQVTVAKKHYGRARSLYRNRNRLAKAVYSVMYLITNWKK